MRNVSFRAAKWSFRFSGVFQFRRRSKRNGRRAGVPKASRLKELRQGRRASKDAGLPLANRKHFLRRAQGSSRGRSAALRTRFLACQSTPQKLRESAAKRLESLARVSLCAPTFVLPHCSKLALGPASASARPTSSPRSSIEVCSRTERSSPFACRSACSGERATLTVTFDSTSGCR
jgi:hypothetical protein